MAQNVKFFILVTKYAILLCHKKCGEWPYYSAQSFTVGYRWSTHTKAFDTALTTTHYYFSFSCKSKPIEIELQHSHTTHTQFLHLSQHSNLFEI